MIVRRAKTNSQCALEQRYKVRFIVNITERLVYDDKPTNRIRAERRKGSYTQISRSGKIKIKCQDVHLCILGSRTQSTPK